MCRGEYEESAYGVSAPILDAARRPVAVVSVWGPQDRVNDSRFDALGALVRDAAHGPHPRLTPRGLTVGRSRANSRSDPPCLGSGGFRLPQGVSWASVVTRTTCGAMPRCCAAGRTPSTTRPTGCAPARTWSGPAPPATRSGTSSTATSARVHGVSSRLRDAAERLDDLAATLTDRQQWLEDIRDKVEAGIDTAEHLVESGAKKVWDGAGDVVHKLGGLL